MIFNWIQLARLQGVPRDALRVSRGVPQTPRAGHVWNEPHGRGDNVETTWTSSFGHLTAISHLLRDQGLQRQDHTVGTQNPFLRNRDRRVIHGDPTAYCDIMSEFRVFAMFTVFVFLSINELNKPDVCNRTSYSYFKEFRLSEISCHLLTCQSHPMLH